ncbi:MAG: FAD-dependent oxidoreductase [Pseudomonadales bacterium]|nr:FAD-dependent oxidoreductase [Pseudomonadales bacterium]
MNPPHIAIIGAGPSGLSAAHALKKKGANVTVFEKNAFAGGQCRSYEVDGKWYDMGAIICIEHNEAYQRFTQQWPQQTQAFFTPRKGARYTRDGKMPKRGKRWHLRILLQLINYSIRYPRQYQQPGFSLRRKDHRPIKQFTRRRQSAEFSDHTDMIMTAYGYGYPDEVSAAYYLKYCEPRILWGMGRRKGIYTMSNGYQNFWHQVAEDFDIRYSSAISQIERQSDGVFIQHGNSKERFDGLVIACALQKTQSFLDTTETENALFSKIQTYDYRTYLCRVRGNYDRPFYHQLDTFSKENAGHVMMWGAQQGNTGVMVAYVQADGLSDEIIHQRLQESLQLMEGGELVEILQQHHWDYFPHVKQAELDDGFYPKLNNLQGQNRTLMVGEIFNFSTVWKCVEWSEHLIEKEYGNWKI